MRQLTGATRQPGDREITVKDNQKNVIAVSTAPEISESPAPVAGLSTVQLAKLIHDRGRVSANPQTFLPRLRDDATGKGLNDEGTPNQQRHQCISPLIPF